MKKKILRSLGLFSFIALLAVNVNVLADNTTPMDVPTEGIHHTPKSDNCPIYAVYSTQWVCNPGNTGCIGRDCDGKVR